MLYRWGTCFLIERKGRFVCVRCNVTYNRFQLVRCTVCVPVLQKRCKYLGNVLGEELIQCNSCYGNVRLKYPINSCDLHNTCLPTYVSSEPLSQWNDHAICSHCPQKKLVTVEP